MALLGEALVWDNHACLPLRPDDERFLPELRRLREVGVHVVGVNVGFGDQSVEQHVRMLAHFRAYLAARPDDYVQVRSVADIELARTSERLGVFFDIEGGGAIADQLELIALYHDLGVRWMSIAYNRRNRLGGGCMDDDDPGLSAFGAAAIVEMNRVGTIVCCSHTGQRTVLDAIACSRDPVIFSHSNPLARWEHRRNIGDAAILACARRGGVVGINGIGVFLSAPGGDLLDAYAECIDYVARLAGIDHVAIALDYVFDTEELLDYLRSKPQLFGSEPIAPEEATRCVAPEALPAIVERLRARGYADTDLAKILGANWLRVAAHVWR